MSEPVVIHFTASPAPLLSGSLLTCHGPEDPSCKGGVAAASAFARAYSGDDPLLFLAFLDRESPFVQMSPLGWSVNRLVYQHLVGAKAFLSGPSVLLQNSGDFEVSARDISALQSQDLPFLLSNVEVPLENSWQPYRVPFLFDHETRLAVMSIVNSNEPLNTPQIETALGGLDYIARVNEEAGCREESPFVDPFEAYLQDTIFVGNNTDQTKKTCWIPVIIFADVKSKFDAFLEAVLAHENRPALILDVEQNAPPLNEPRQVADGTWLVSYGLYDFTYQHQVITLNEDETKIANVTLIHHDLNFTLPNVQAKARDERYNNTITTLASLAEEARLNDPMVAQSVKVPTHKDGNYRRCKAGACEAGSLFMDAQRWWKGVDIAFANSGGFRGDGWPAGPVHVSNIWDSLPFPNNLCTGVMSGVSVFNVFNFSTSWATFEGENTATGGLLLQVSGIRLTYNTNLKHSRLIALDIWDDEANDYIPVDRLKLYTFVTDSYMCAGYDPYIDFFGSRLVFPGEERGVIDTSVTQQEVVAEYLKHLKTTYEPAIEGRMINDTETETFLNLVQTEASCSNDEWWNDVEYTCIPCPENSGVVVLKDVLAFDGEKGSDPSPTQSQNISLVNTLPHNVSLVTRSAPFWVKIANSVPYSETPAPLSLEGILFDNLAPGQEVTLVVDVDVAELQAGTATGSVVFGALDEQEFPGCIRPDASFGVTARIDPPQELNQLGSIRYLGWTLAAVVITTALFMTSWVVKNRKSRIVMTLQPLFLIMISFGVIVMGSALIPLGIDDEIASVDACSHACMAFPWLLSLGFTIAMSALFSKLWRINQLFNHPQLRKITVTEKDVLGPFLVLFGVNLVALTIWTVVDPLRWQRKEIDGKRWETYGTCRPDDGAVSVAMIFVVASVNAAAFLLTCYQAFKARNISDEFSESRSLGVALFSWVQLLLVGVPVLFLIAQDNPSARYFINSGLTFAVCMSMLLLIYVPILVQKRKAAQLQNSSQERSQKESSETESRDSISKRSSSIKPFTANDIGKTRISGLYSSKDMAELSEELAKLPFQEQTPIGDLEEGSQSTPSDINVFLDSAGSQNKPRLYEQQMMIIREASRETMEREHSSARLIGDGSENLQPLDIEYYTDATGDSPIKQTEDGAVFPIPENPLAGPQEQEGALDLAGSVALSNESIQDEYFDEE